MAPHRGDATEVYWSRIMVALVVNEMNLSSLSRAVGIAHNAISNAKDSCRKLRQNELDTLLAETGASREFIENPEPVDLSNETYGPKPVFKVRHQRMENRTK